MNVRAHRFAASSKTLRTNCTALMICQRIGPKCYGEAVGNLTSLAGEITLNRTALPNLYSEASTAFRINYSFLAYVLFSLAGEITLNRTALPNLYSEASTAFRINYSFLAYVLERCPVKIKHNNFVGGKRNYICTGVSCYGTVRHKYIAFEPDHIWD